MKEETKAQKPDAQCAIFGVTCRTSVNWFARNMELKLRENDYKGGWDKCEHSWLLSRLKQEVTELEKALNQVDNQENVIREAADVANFALMIADLAGRLYGR
jgi:NTP pyrophosphatase (non-canonical NTP hydrolase)